MIHRPSLHDLREWPATPADRIRAQKNAAYTYREFVEALDRAIDYISSEMSKNPQFYQNQSEDQITHQIAMSLRMIGFLATFEKKVGGHCDVVVEWDDVGLWLGEAKIFSGDYGWLYKGFQQLCTRYSTGSSFQNSGGLLIYLRDARSMEIMTRWRERLQAEQADISIEACQRDEFAFRSRHVLERSDRNFFVRHKPLSFYFAPMDGRPPKRVRKKTKTGKQ